MDGDGEAERIDAQIAWIDGASYEQLLEKWRNAPSGSTWFTGEVGKHFAEVMQAKRAEVGDAGHVAASKAIGW